MTESICDEETGQVERITEKTEPAEDEQNLSSNKNQNNDDHTNISWKSCAVFVLHEVKEVILGSWGHVLLPFVPAGMVVKYTNQSAVIIFAVNFVAIIPSSAFIGLGMKEVNKRTTNGVLVTLIYMTFGNASQLITSVLLLRSRQIALLQTSLIGGILSNMHLMLGLGFLIGGLRWKEQLYNSTVTQSMGSLLVLAMTSLIIPTATQLLANPVPGGVLKMSRGTSVVLIVIYAMYLLFQLGSHSYIWEGTPQQIIEEESHPGILAGMLHSSSSSETDSSTASSGVPRQQISHIRGRVARLFRSQASTPVSRERDAAEQKISTIDAAEAGSISRGVASQGSRPTSLLSDDSQRPTPSRTHQERQQRSTNAPVGTNTKEESEGSPRIHLLTAFAVLAIGTTLLTFNTLFATDSVGGLIERAGVTKTFVGIVLLPLFTNDPTPIATAMKNRMDTCIASTVGRCIQTALFVTPFIVILGWIMRIENMTLSFDGFEVAALFASVLYINFLTLDGRSNWLEGAALIAMFVVISLAAFYVE